MNKLSNVAIRLNRRSGQTWLPPLLLLTDDQRLADPAGAMDRLPAGSGVVLRHYANPARRDLAFRLAIDCRKKGLKLFVAGDLALALSCNADGLHLPAWQVPASRRAVGIWTSRPNRIVTAAAHSIREALQAASVGADAVLVSPIFATASHLQTPALGPRRLAAIWRAAQLPSYALGGVDQENVNQLIHSQIVGVAGISGF